MLTVSVVIITYNRADFLKEAIESVLAQTYQDYELIIVDDGSTDHTRDVVRLFDDNRIRYFHHENRGMTPTRNRGIREATGEYIAFLDSDDVWFPEKLSRQVEVARKTGAGLVHTSRYETDLSGKKPRLVRPLRPARSSDEFLKGNTHISLTVLVRRDALIETGLFDEDLKASDDTDMWLRLARNNVEFRYIDEILMDVRKHGANVSRDPEWKFISRVCVAQKMLEGHDKRIPRAVWRGKLAENYYLLAIQKYEKKLYPACTRLIIKALKINVFAGWLITYPKDGLLLRLKIALSPYSLLLKSVLKTKGGS